MSGELLFLPLGGAGEIGMNASLYGHAGKWLMVDLGVAFGDDSAPGIDLMVPDIGFIAERRRDLLGLVITHGHEDHLGAVAYLWRRLRCPVYASPFAAALLRRKLDEAGLAGETRLTVVRTGETVEIGPFKVGFIAAAHSIPEGHFLSIRTPAGLAVHATDWKLDPDPVVGHLTDEAALRALGDAGPEALVCDSTNAFVPGEAGSERALEPALARIMEEAAGRVAVACFASNVARLHTVCTAAAKAGRQVALIGRSLWQIVEAARETGHFSDMPPLLAEDEAGFLPPDALAMVVTGSQGEPRSALARIAAGEHRSVVLEPGDTVVFSSRMIPGNEISIGRVQNALARAGVRVITEHDAHVHVSGHPARGELTRLYEWVRPKRLIPIHGEARHLFAHQALARASGIAETLIVENGQMARIAPGPAEIVEHVAAGRLAVDGTRLVPLDGEVMRDRRRLRFGGAAVATVVLDGKGRLAAEPRLTVHGLLDEENAADAGALADALAAIVEAVESLPAPRRRADEEVSEAARRAVRRTLYDTLGKRPVTDVHVVRV